jgi:uncharacterized phage infection (PIP) family protein YhgE
MPKISETISAAPPGRINVHYNQLKEAVEKIQSGESTQEQYLETLNFVYNTIYERLIEVENMEISEEIKPDFEEQYQLGLSGIHFFLQGIEELKLYVEDSNSDHLTSGMESAYQGNENLNQALEMAREGLRRLKEIGVDSEFDIMDN